jgi:hypothetical protein
MLYSTREFPGLVVKRKIYETIDTEDEVSETIPENLRESDININWTV